MKLGEKIKFIRTLRGMTQKELGLKVGFSAATADNRIRQYEIGKMKPKEDKLGLIADALNVPVETLNDIDISPDNRNALFNILFELERTEGLQVKKIGNQFVLSFDPEHPLSDFYNSGLSSWYYVREKYFPTKESINNDDNIHDYEVWTQEYPINVKENEKANADKVKQLHSIAIEEAQKSFTIKTVSEYIKIFENMMRCGVHIDIKKNALLSSQGKICVQVRLSHKELLKLNGAAINAYAKFIALINYLTKANQDMLLTTSSYDNVTYDEYNICSSTLATALLTTVIWIQKELEAGTLDDDISQIEYKSDLDQFNIPIEDAIIYK